MRVDGRWGVEGLWCITKRASRCYGMVWYGASRWTDLVPAFIRTGAGLLLPDIIGISP